MRRPKWSILAVQRTGLPFNAKGWQALPFNGKNLHIQGFTGRTGPLSGKPSLCAGRACVPVGRNAECVTGRFDTDRGARSRYYDRRAATQGGVQLSSEGLSEDPKVYRSRLAEQSDEQLDAWMIEFMRDTSIRRGVLAVLAAYRKATGLDDAGIERVFTAGGGAPATIGRTADGELMVPAASLHFLVPGLRAQSEEARDQEIDFLVGGFDNVVYI